MKFRLVLSFLLLTASFAVRGQEKQPDEKGLTKVSIMYPFAEGKTFNMEYYKDKHMPMVAGFLGSNLVKYTIEKGVASGIPNQPLPYMAIGTFLCKRVLVIIRRQSAAYRCNKGRLRELLQYCTDDIN